MTADLLAIGVDPGPTPGIVALRWCTGPSGLFLDHADVIQCTPGLAPALVNWLLVELAYDPCVRAVVQTERFVVGRGSQRTGRAGAVTRDLVGAVEATVRLHRGGVNVQRNASPVKQWATDARLMALSGVGQPDLYRLTSGMRHARDAARHALFAACHDGQAPDPLSTRSAR